MKSDVVVCGGGPAGVCAALAAARSGVSVRLIEMGGCLGGILTGGLLSWILDSKNKNGILREIMNEMAAKGHGRFAESGSFVCDPEMLKRHLEKLCINAGIRIRLYTQISGAVVENGRITGVKTRSKSGEEIFHGDVFIDATGDGDLGAYAGCGFDFGMEHTGAAQPMSLIALLTGANPDEISQFINSNKLEVKGKYAMLEEVRRAGFEPSYYPSLFQVRDDYYIFMANHQYEVKGINADDLTRATLEARAELHDMIDALRALGGKWAGLRLLMTAPQIGVREGRRIHGLYTVTREDAITGKKHDDAICSPSFGLDVHAPKRDGDNHYALGGGVKQPYDIPLGAIIAKDVDGLMMAGRCISGDFYAHASYRVVGNAMTIGESAGRAAAEAVRRKIMPRELVV